MNKVYYFTKLYTALPTSSSSGAFDSRDGVLKTRGVNDTSILPPDLGGGTSFFFFTMKKIK